LVAALGGSVDFYKVGMELYAACGMDFVRELLAQGKRVFLDMKFYDIGETVKRAVGAGGPQRRVDAHSPRQLDGDGSRC